MINAYNQFKQHMSYVRELHSVYTAISPQSIKSIDLSDILRAEIVFAVSAFDFYIHEIVRLGLIEIYLNKRSITPSARQLSISLESVMAALRSGPTDVFWLEKEIKDKLGWRSFQRSDNVNDALKYIIDDKIWKLISDKIGSLPEDVKRELDLIIDRRNKIAHEADIDPTSPGARWPIDEMMIFDTVNFIEELVKAIDSIVSQPLSSNP